MLLQRCACLFFLVGGFVLNSSTYTIAVEQSRLDQIRIASLSQVRLIRSVEFTMHYESRMELGDAVLDQLPPEGETFPREMVQKGQVLYVEAGGRYRIETDLTDANAGDKDTEIAAYNGDRYQLFYKEKKALTSKKTPTSLNPSRTANPLTMAYVWLLDEDASHVLSEVKNERYWNERFASALYRGQREESGMVVDVVEFPYPFKKDLPKNMQNSVVQVYFAASLGYYPVASIAQSKDGRVFGEIRVTKHKELSVDGQKAIVPLELSTKMRVPGGVEVTGTSTILPETIKINHAIDEDFFTIPPTWATIVEDADETEIEFQKLDQERTQLKAKAKAWRERPKMSDIPSRNSRAAGIVFTCAIIVFLSLLVYRRHTK